MPHIIVEYTKNLEDKINLPDMLIALHDALSDQGIDKGRIKTRGIALDHAIVGAVGANGTMAHATLLLLEGRDTATKKSYGDALYKVMHDHLEKAGDQYAATLEIRDMAKDTYYL